MNSFTFKSVNRENVDTVGFFCIRNKKHVGYQGKDAWFKSPSQTQLGFEILLSDDGSEAGFVEFAPGETTWRIIEAPGWLIIHCLMINPRKFTGKGNATALINRVQEIASNHNHYGVAAIVRDGSWMIGKDIFLKAGFQQVDESEPDFQIVAKPLSDGPLPRFPEDLNNRLTGKHELELIYTNQCPYISKAVNELPPVAISHGTTLKLTEINDPAEARRLMPTPYGTFCLVHDEKILSHHPISATRFKNILQRDLGLKPA
jgi:hypothetical protein